jgi:hypothetical protein
LLKRGFRPFEDYDGLMKAKTFTRFWERWYGVPRRELLHIFNSKYHPTRYQGLNLHSFNYRGTIEFRYVPRNSVFNKSEFCHPES